MVLFLRVTELFSCLNAKLIAEKVAFYIKNCIRCMEVKKDGFLNPICGGLKDGFLNPVVDFSRIYLTNEFQYDIKNLSDYTSLVGVRWPSSTQNQ